MRPDPAEILRCARYYLYRIDLSGGQVEILDVAREFYSAAFLDDRATTGKTLGGWRLPVDALLEAKASTSTPAASSTGWIFHVGHCGSTLLSRLLDRLPGVLGLREPLPLLAMAGAVLERDSPLGTIAPQRVDAALSLVTDLLARGYEDTRRVIVKATSTASLLAPAVLELRAQDRAVLLTLGLSRYLAAYLRDSALRAQARADAMPRLAAWHRWSGDDSLRLWQLGDAQIIALNWLVETERFARLARDPATADRVLILDGDELVAQPAQCLAQVALHLGIDADEHDIAQAIGGDILNRYAKQPGRAYDAATRERDLAQAAAEFSPEISAATEWIRQLDADHPHFRDGA